MTRHAAFLRGINLGRRRLKMDELRRHVRSAGLEGVDTFLASGNVVFDHEGTDTALVERDLEAHLEESLGFATEVFVRTLADLEHGILGLEIVEKAREEGFKPHVLFTRDPVGAETERALHELGTPDDRFHVLGREVIRLRRGGIADAPVGPRDLERALGPSHTMRTLNTVRRMVAKYGG